LNAERQNDKERIEDKIKEVENKLKG